MFAGILLCFLLSGFAGLLYQIAWTREFALVFGSTDRAAAIVLTPLIVLFLLLLLSMTLLVMLGLTGEVLDW